MDTIFFFRFPLPWSRESSAMAVKLLMLLLVIGAIYFAGRYHAVRKQRQLAREPVTLIPEGGPDRRWMIAGGVVALAAAVGLYSLHAWEESRKMVRIRVININTGHNQLYETRRHLVGARSFQTMEGRRVNLADVERMEVEEPVP